MILVRLLTLQPVIYAGLLDTALRQLLVVAVYKITDIVEMRQVSSWYTFLQCGSIFVMCIFISRQTNIYNWTKILVSIFNSFQTKPELNLN